MNALKIFGLSTALILLSALTTFAQTDIKKNKTQEQSQPGNSPTSSLASTLPDNTVSITIPRNQISDDILSKLVRRENPNANATETPKEESSVFGGMFDWVKDKYSAMLNVMPGQITNVMLYKFIEEWYGTRYRMGGTSKSGVDCSAFVQNLYQYVFNQPLLRTAWMQFDSSNEIIKNMNELKEGDLVFFKINSSRITHVGVYLKNNFFVHSASSKGVSIASLTSDYWSKYFVGGGRVKK